VYTKQWT